jgi:hypothetical protein
MLSSSSSSSSKVSTLTTPYSGLDSMILHVAEVTVPLEVSLSVSLRYFLGERAVISAHYVF